MNILSLQCLGESRKRNDILSIISHPREEKARLSAEASSLLALLLQGIPVVPSSAQSKADLKGFPHLDRSSRTSIPSFSSWLLASSFLPPMLGRCTHGPATTMASASLEYISEDHWTECLGLIPTGIQNPRAMGHMQYVEDPVYIIPRLSFQRSPRLPNKLLQALD